ncbi:DUF2591 domain-containing protein [Proteus sp. G2609]|uniref:phage protein NinX family protein n=1 Tax=Proteus sp. G2609 TaxID=2698840 RepID=UPI00137847C6|nr:DUF2591 domain-containing protein [Proteus sp. G2609]
MNKYTELSDFEINKKVAEKLGAEWFVTTTVWDELVVMVGSKCFKPCNNPSDAMPIIIENLISLMSDMSEDRESTWWCASDISNGITSRYKSNPYRAAMEVFLMIKDAENES